MLEADRAIYQARHKQGYSMANYRPVMTGIILADIVEELRQVPITELEQLAKSVFDDEALVSLDVEWQLPLRRKAFEEKN